MLKHSLISLDSIKFTFVGPPKVYVLDNISLNIERNELAVIVGPSGCGKTTLLKVIAGLYSNSDANVDFTGSILINGKPPNESLKNHEFGFVFQESTLLPWRTVIDNIRLPLEIIGSRLKRDPREPKELIELVGLSDFTNAYPSQLSVGMQQRISIARGLVFKPSILLMDEPFGALDELRREALNLELIQIKKRTGATIVFVTHSVSEAVALASHKIIVMTPRPSKVNIEVPMNSFPDNEKNRRHTKQFINLVQKVRKNLYIEEK